MDSNKVMHRTIEDTYGDSGSCKASSICAGATSCLAGYKFKYLLFHGRRASALHRTRDSAEAADALCTSQPLCQPCIFALPPTIFTPAYERVH